MTDSHTQYQGYANYETFSVDVTWRNDQPICTAWRDIARRTFDTAREGPVSGVTKSGAARFLLAERMNETIHKYEYIHNPLTRSLLGASISRIDFLELADIWLTDADIPNYNPRATK